MLTFKIKDQGNSENADAYYYKKWRSFRIDLTHMGSPTKSAMGNKM